MMPLIPFVPLALFGPLAIFVPSALLPPLVVLGSVFSLVIDSELLLFLKLALERLRMSLKNEGAILHL